MIALRRPALIDANLATTTRDVRWFVITRAKMNPTKFKTKTVHAPGRPHPRNRHSERYDFVELVAACPDLTAFVVPHPCGGDTIDFSNPEAVKSLNRALLKSQYRVAHWDIPQGYLCPPIPSRADYIHHVADLLSDGRAREIPRGPAVRILDIGVGANCVYPIIGCSEYGWRFVGADIDRVSIEWGRRLVAANRHLSDRVEIRLQSHPSKIFDGVIGPDERFDASICNPPFHASAHDAAAGTLRKVRNLGANRNDEAILNFGGKANELWCDGGESGFVRRMILQSAQRREQVLWFTTLVSKRGSLPAIHHALAGAQAADVRTIAMAQGQKQSRIVAWTFQDPAQRAAWQFQRASAAGDAARMAGVGRSVSNVDR
ncbi:MAG TPA: 23S rRNA (adenine(1618)-N(6))-methyltransferase RlmF [Opitutus sp.]|nr:23S rRNA (adenine(1618)-N(6))-methyltransferase RlmF [Opitutus sp.]